MKEARKQERTDAVSFLEVRDAGTGREVGRVTDISIEGMRLLSPDPFEPEAGLEFELIMPPRRRTRGGIRFDAKVIWCRKAGDTGQYESGIRMDNITPEDIDVIRQIMEEAPFEHAHLNLHRPRPMEH